VASTSQEALEEGALVEEDLRLQVINPPLSVFGVIFQSVFIMNFGYG